MKKIGVVLLTLVFLGVSSVIAGAIGAAFQLSSSSVKQGEVKINGGVIRLDDKRGVYIHTNSSHHSIGFDRVYVNKGDGALVIVRDQKDAVVTTSVTPDEYLTKKGVSVGLSGGGKVTKIFFYKDGRQLNLAKPSDYSKIASPVSNIWVMIVSN